MGILIVIIGRYGVGKTLLSRQFELNGVSVIDTTQILMNELSRLEHASIWRNCLNKRYELLSAKIPLATGQFIDSMLSYLNSERTKYDRAVVVLPSFLPVQQIIKKGNFSCIVAVDCSDILQQKYIQQSYSSSKLVKLLCESSQERDYYTTVATDIFLNSIEKTHMVWVAAKILRTYELSFNYD